ncbi:MAG: tetratricopeptide repeat protein [Pseudomonadota bacterium]
MADLSRLPSLIQAQDWAAAERLLRRAAQARRAPPEVFYNLGKVLAAAGKPHQSPPWYRKAVQARPDYAIAWFELGAAEMAEGRLRAAYAAFGRALALDPADRDAQRTLARLSLRLGEWEQAARLWAPFADTDTDTEAAVARYRIACETGDWPTATALLAKLRADPQTRLLALQAMTRTGRGRLSLALPS